MALRLRHKSFGQLKQLEDAIGVRIERVLKRMESLKGERLYAYANGPLGILRQTRKAVHREILRQRLTGKYR